MFNDFINAFIIGWAILLLFWLTILIFIYFRNPPNSKLNKKITISTLMIFLIVLFILVFFK